MNRQNNSKAGRCLIVGLSGFAFSGKDYTNTFAGNILLGRNIVGICGRYAFADPIKEHVNSMFGWNESHSFGSLKNVIDPYWGFSPRKAYQLFGTEFGRSLHADLWVKMTMKKIAKSKQYFQGVDSVFFITDVRFHNEAKTILDSGGLVISIVRPEYEPTIVDGVKTFPSGVPMHESESYIEEIREYASMVLMNDEGYETNIEQLITLIEGKINE